MSAIARYIGAYQKFGRLVQPRAAAWAKLAAAEMKPPSIAGFKQDLGQLVKNMQNVGDMTMNQLAGRALVLVEIPLWFVVGEMIGRGSIVGYNFDKKDVENCYKK